ncbi:MAG: hypothetical protein V1799_11930, partial [bacterium]
MKTALRINRIGTTQLTRLMVIAVLAMMIALQAFARVVTDYRSKQSGAWSAASTWERYDGSNWVAAVAVPTSSDGVVTIQNGHTITVDANSNCSSILIQSGGFVQNSSGASYTLIVQNTFENNGTVQNNGATFTLNVNGNTTNNGTWVNAVTNFAGTGTIGGPSAYGGACNIAGTGRSIAGSVTINTMTVSDGGILGVGSGTTLTTAEYSSTSSTGKVEGSGTMVFGATQDIRGTYKVTTIKIATGAKSIPDIGSDPDILFEGTLTVEASGVLQNKSGSTVLMQMNGPLVNNIDGIIQNNGSTFTLNANGNTTNNGTWTNAATNFMGTGTIEGSSAYGGYSSIAGTGRSITGNVTLNYLVVQDGGSLGVGTGTVLTTTQYSTTSSTGRVEGLGTMVFGNTQDIRGTYKVSTIKITSGVKNIVDISADPDIVFEGALIVEASGVLQNKSGSTVVAQVNGSLTNNASGIIQTNGSSFTL